MMNFHDLTKLHFAKKSVMSRSAATIEAVGRILQSYNITVSQSHTCLYIHTKKYRSRIAHIYATYSGQIFCNFVRCPQWRGFCHIRDITKNQDRNVMTPCPCLGRGRVLGKQRAAGALSGSPTSGQLLITAIIGSNYQPRLRPGVGRSGSGFGVVPGSPAIPPATARPPGGPPLWPRDEFTSVFRVPAGSRMHRSDAYWRQRIWQAWVADRRRWWRDLAIAVGAGLEGGGQ